MNAFSNQNKSLAKNWFSLELGWFSIVLGLLGLFAPRKVARTIGTRNRPFLFRLIGLREILSGIGILTSRQKTGWIWSRVFGDAMDLTMLGMARRERGSNRKRLGVTMEEIASVTVIDTLGAIFSRPDKSIHVVKTITISRTPEELYGAWRSLTNLPQFMANLESIQIIDEKHSHWVAKAPAGTHVEWDAEITEDIPNRKISWQSLPNADVQNSGTVEFIPAPGGRGTAVCVVLDYTPIAGTLGARIAWLFGKFPEQQINVDLHRFEQWMETGLVTVTEGQPTGRAHSNSMLYDVATGR